jgi:hypothetical protein
MTFWEGETCEYCGGSIIEKKVTIHRKIKGRIESFKNGLSLPYVDSSGNHRRRARHYRDLQLVHHQHDHHL